MDNNSRLSLYRLQRELGPASSEEALRKAALAEAAAAFAEAAGCRREVYLLKAKVWLDYAVLLDQCGGATGNPLAPRAQAV